MDSIYSKGVNKEDLSRPGAVKVYLENTWRKEYFHQ